MIVLILNHGEISLIDLLIIVKHREVSRFKLFTRSTVSLNLLDPLELLEDSLSVLRAVLRYLPGPLILLLLLLLINYYLFNDIFNRLDVLVDEILGLLLLLRQLVHVLVTAVIALRARILNSLLQTTLQSLIVRESNTQHRVVFVEGIHLLDFEDLLLEGSLLLLREAAVEVIESFAQSSDVLLASALLNDHLVQEEEEKGDVET